MVGDKKNERTESGLLEVMMTEDKFSLTMQDISGSHCLKLFI